MPLDAICINALAKELNEKASGAKIEKIQQPARDMILISLRSFTGQYKLLINVGTGSARVHFTELYFENPSEPPMFCMLLRKHLIGARIISVTQPEHERMLQIELESRTEMGDTARRTLIAELIGRSSNLILCDNENRIIDCLRRSAGAGESARAVLPGMLYRMPPKQNKKNIFDYDGCGIDASDEEQDVSEYLLNSFAGISPLVCRELSVACGNSFGALNGVLTDFTAYIKSDRLRPTALIIDGILSDFCFMPVLQYGAKVELKTYNSFSKMLDEYYESRDNAELQRRRSKQLRHDVSKLAERLAKKLSLQKAELKKTETMDEVRIKAELITANLYRIKKGQGELVCENYYLTDCPSVTIPLDRLKTPQQNSAALFKEYNKLRGAKLHLTELISKGEEQLSYLSSVLDEIGIAQSEKDLSAIREELLETGFIKEHSKQRKAKEKKQSSMSFRAEDGSEILVGRSNIQNDELTFKLARRTDYWFHVQKIHGSHVILRCYGLEPSYESIQRAAELAAFYSHGREGGKAAVDYCMARFVKKPSGALPGMVIYTDYKTIVVAPKE